MAVIPMWRTCQHQPAGGSCCGHSLDITGWHAVMCNAGGEPASLVHHPMSNFFASLLQSFGATTIRASPIPEFSTLNNYPRAFLEVRSRKAYLTFLLCTIRLGKLFLTSPSDTLVRHKLKRLLPEIRDTLLAAQRRTKQKPTLLQLAGMSLRSLWKLMDALDRSWRNGCNKCQLMLEPQPAPKGSLLTVSSANGSFSWALPYTNALPT